MEEERVPYWEREEPLRARGDEIELLWYARQGILRINRTHTEPGTGYTKRTHMTLVRGEMQRHPELVALFTAAFADWNGLNDGGETP